jgi:hypothetical protein
MFLTGLQLLKLDIYHLAIQDPLNLNINKDAIIIDNYRMAPFLTSNMYYENHKID